MFFARMRERAATSRALGVAPSRDSALSEMRVPSDDIKTGGCEVSATDFHTSPAAAYEMNESATAATAPRTRDIGIFAIRLSPCSFPW